MKGRKFAQVCFRFKDAWYKTLIRRIILNVHEVQLKLGKISKNNIYWCKDFDFKSFSIKLGYIYNFS